MDEKEFDEGIKNIKELLKKNTAHERIYIERKDYGKKVKIFNIVDLNVINQIFFKVRFYEEYIISGEIQFYVVNRFGKRSVIIKCFNQEKEIK